jgi:hypothetical protein
MDEQLSTWMNLIWSSRCLALLYTSTQSSNIKWASGGGINIPRHQISCWLKVVESSTVGWSGAILFQASVRLVLLVVSLHCTWSLTELLRRYASTYHRIIRCSRPHGQNLTVSFTRPLNEPMLTHRFIWCYCIDLGVFLSCLTLTIGWTDGSLQWTVGSSNTTDFSALTLQLAQRY